MNIKDLSVEEKVSLLSGATTWTTTALNKAEIPSVRLTDGANGVRNEDIVATCFPSPVAVASSFDTDAAFSLGQAFAKECRHFGTNILLAPSMNIKRSPLCGRNFGYYSEDPVVSGETAGAFVRGLQSQGVGGCLKHFAVYNQETRRMSSNCVLDDTALNEIYLKGFEIAVKNSDPACVMTSYNFCGGVHSSQNKTFITDKLRNEWGFNGFTVSDWGGVYSRPHALNAGLDLQMPFSPYGNDKILKAYKEGSVSEETIDKSVIRIAKIAKKYAAKRADCDFEYSKKVAYNVAVKSVVLLKNDGGILPLKKGAGRIAVIGEGAKDPQIQGGGCDHTKLLWNTDFIEELKIDLIGAEIVYEQGYVKNSDKDDATLTEKALSLAKTAETVIFFLSLPESYESEAYDRKDLNCPVNQTNLLRKILKVNKNVAVILQNGAPIDLKHVVKAKAVIESYLLGGIWGKALSAIVTGKENPSGKLAETFPLKIEDTPCFTGFGETGGDVKYSEGLFVGYRHYTSTKIKTAFPFGYGKSYTEFAVKDVVTDSRTLKKGGKITVSFTVENVGDRFGGEVVQVYVGNLNHGNARPVKELKKFVKFYLKAGESKRCSVTLLPEDIAVYSEKKGRFAVEDGKYSLTVSVSCVDDIKRFTFTAKGFSEPEIYTRDSLVGDILKTKKGRKIVEKHLLGYLYMAMFGNFNGDITLKDDVTKSPFFTSIMNDMPLNSLCSFTGGAFGDEKLNAVLTLLNEQ